MWLTEQDKTRHEKFGLTCNEYLRSSSNGRHRIGINPAHGHLLTVCTRPALAQSSLPRGRRGHREGKGKSGT
ncbi:protein of unknown function [Rhodovastum atsumiense]|nr:protein of unknown function [Rhodovastum atsumiense]